MLNVFQRPSDIEKNRGASLYFGNIDKNADELLMYELFLQVGPVKSVNIPKDKLLKVNQGFGFVEFKNFQDAEYALRVLKGVRLFGRPLKLKKAEHQKTAHSLNTGLNMIGYENANLNTIDVGAKLFINNLNPLIDEQFLLDIFIKFGTLIKSPVVVRDEETGESKKYGFVTFEDFSIADKVVDKMNGAILMNHKISVTYSYKEDPITGLKKKKQHGDKVERVLAEHAKQNGVLVLSQSNKQKKKIKNLR